MDWRIRQPSRFRAVAPLSKQLAQLCVAELLLALLVALFLQRQRLVIDKPTGARETAHLAMLFSCDDQFEFEGLKSLHDLLLLIYTVIGL